MMFSKPTTHDLIPVKSFAKEPEQRHSILHDSIFIKGDWQSDGTVEFGGEITGNLTEDLLIVKGPNTVETALDRCEAGDAFTVPKNLFSKITDEQREE